MELNIDINENIVRKMSNYVNATYGTNKLLGSIYFNLHNAILFIIGFIVLFTTSPVYLAVILTIVSLDAISIVFLHECPLTTMEKKYLGVTSCEIRNEMLENAGIVYKCDHNYEKQIELLINVWLIIATKCACIVFLRMFDIKLFDSSGIYLKTNELPIV